MLAVGLGGIFVEVLQDVALRVLPVSPEEVRRMLGELKGAKLLEGQRGIPAADLDAVATVIARIGDAVVALGPDSRNSMSIRSGCAARRSRRWTRSRSGANDGAPIYHSCTSTAVSGRPFTSQASRPPRYQWTLV